MAYRKRAFLNPISTGKPSFVFAVAESSEGGKKAHGNYVLTVADCKRMVELVRIPADREHPFRFIVSTHSGSS